MMARDIVILVALFVAVHALDDGLDFVQVAPRHVETSGDFTNYDQRAVNEAESALIRMSAKLTEILERDGLPNGIAGLSSHKIQELQDAAAKSHDAQVKAEVARQLEQSYSELMQMSVTAADKRLKRLVGRVKVNSLLGNSKDSSHEEQEARELDYQLNLIQSFVDTRKVALLARVRSHTGPNQKAEMFLQDVKQGDEIDFETALVEHAVSRLGHAPEPKTKQTTNEHRHASVLLGSAAAERLDRVEASLRHMRQNLKAHRAGIEKMTSEFLRDGSHSHALWKRAVDAYKTASTAGKKQLLEDVRTLVSAQELRAQDA